MKKIIIDGRLLSNKPTGISRYTKEVIQALIEHYNRANVFVLVDAEYSNIDNYNTIITKLKPYNPIHYLLFSLFIYRQDYSIYYSTFYSGLHFKERKRKQILTVHDLAYLQIKNYFSQSTLRNTIYKIILNCIIRSSLRASNLVISVSRATRNDLLKYFETDSIVIREGVNYLNEKSTVNNNILDRLKIKKGKFFLYVGNFRKQKNTSFLIEAFNRSNTLYQLVMVGDKGFLQNMNENIIFTGILDDDEIHCLYKNCVAFVMPSFYEGFGLTILEAYCAGARVLSSDRGALCEFNDLRIYYFSPFNLDELIFLLQNIDKLSKPSKIEIDLARETYNWQVQTKRIIDSIESLN
jgi:glycosyltransferase involved in cell wall biosynthesis